jgi:glyceraldehyde-3-phosphate dehydrogenase (NADP+)
MSSILSNVFPEEASIPKSIRLEKTIEQREYLINCVMKTWNGPLNPVLSPVFVKSGNNYNQKVIGSTPLLTSVEALEALEAAVEAYNNGQGSWATMNVAGRIEHVEKFLLQM